MLHGRGASAEDILSLALELRHTDFAYLAPQAAGNVWYPYRFMEPMERNEPWPSSPASWTKLPPPACHQSGPWAFRREPVSRWSLGRATRGATAGWWA